MVSDGDIFCPVCGGELRYYDSIKRVVRTKRRISKYVIISRMRCSICGRIHRALPKYVFPHCQYEAEVIRGVIEGLIDSDTLGFEDYPCEMTMRRWRAKFTTTIMEREGET